MSKRTKKPELKAVPAPVVPTTEIQLDEISALRLLRAEALFERDRTRFETMKGEALRYLEQIDADGKFRAMDRQLGELLPGLQRAELEVVKLSQEIGQRLGIDPTEYTLDEKTFLLRRRDPPVPETAKEV